MIMEVAALGDGKPTMQEWGWRRLMLVGGQPGGVELAFGDDDGRAGQPRPAGIQGDREFAAGDGDRPGIPLLPGLGGGGRSGGGSGGHRAGSAGPGFAR